MPSAAFRIGTVQVSAKCPHLYKTTAVPAGSFIIEACTAAAAQKTFFVKCRVGAQVRVN